MHNVQSKARAGGLYVEHPGYCLVAQIGSRCTSAHCLSLSYLTTVVVHLEIGRLLSLPLVLGRLGFESKPNLVV